MRFLALITLMALMSCGDSKPSEPPKPASVVKFEEALAKAEADLAECRKNESDEAFVKCIESMDLDEFPDIALKAIEDPSQRDGRDYQVIERFEAFLAKLPPI